MTRPSEYAARAVAMMAATPVVHATRCREFSLEKIYIGRAVTLRDGAVFEASEWANPHRVDGNVGRWLAVKRYADDLCADPARLARVPSLRGHPLVCWCAPKLCHGHALALTVALLKLDCPPHLLRMALEMAISIYALEQAAPEQGRLL